MKKVTNSIRLSIIETKMRYIEKAVYMIIVISLANFGIIVT